MGTLSQAINKVLLESVVRVISKARIFHNKCKVKGINGKRDVM